MKIVWVEKGQKVDKLVDECIEIVDEVKMARITLAKDENKHKNKWSSCTLYIVFFCNNFYNQHGNWFLFCLLKIHESR